MTLKRVTLPSIIQRATSRHLCEIAEGYSHKWICNTYYRNVDQCVTFPLSFAMVVNLFGHKKKKKKKKKKNFSTVEFGEWSVDRVKYIKFIIFAVLQ